jgi:hypothetical protein
MGNDGEGSRDFARGVRRAWAGVMRVGGALDNRVRGPASDARARCQARAYAWANRAFCTIARGIIALCMVEH